MSRLPDPVTVLSVGTALLLGLFFGVVLPPRQTADVVGITAVTLAHILVTWIAYRLYRHRPALFALTGTMVCAALYWLAAVGLTLLWRLLQLTDSLLLAALQLGLLLVVLLLCYLFALTDRGVSDEEQQKDR